MKQTLILDNLTCAHCAAKIEVKIAATEGYRQVSYNFATKKLQFETDNSHPRAEIQAICDSIEDGVQVLTESEYHPHAQHAHHAHCSDAHGDCVHDHHSHEHTHEHVQHAGDVPKKVLLMIAAVLGVAALAVHLLSDSTAAQWTVFGLSLAATLTAGYEVFLKGLKNTFHLHIEETVLITIAVIAAFFLGEYVEAAMVTILFSVGELIEDMAVGKSRRDIEKLSQIRPDTATVLENGQEHIHAASDVAVGSLILVKPHERVPLDGIVITGSASLDVSALTGESLPHTVTAGSEVLSGSMNGDSLLTLKTTKAFGDSTATRILRLVEDAAAQKGTREKLITRFANVYTPVVVGLAVLTAVLPPLLGLGSFSLWIYRALIVLVASCPCAIVISVPLSYYSGIGACSRVGMLVKGGKYLEALAKADCFAFDKTGTLTTGKIAATHLYAYNGYSEDEVLSLAAACEKYSSHPIAAAIKARAGKQSIALTDYKEVAGSGTSAQYNGKTLACGNAKLLTEAVPEELRKKNAVYVVYDDTLIGAVEISDELRSEARDVLHRLSDFGANKLLMLTGDARQNADTVARELDGIETHAELLPQDKLDIISQAQADGQTVCFVGDGINDAPVLGKSDCGIAMGLGSEAAIESADAVLSPGDLSPLPKAVHCAKKTMRTIRSNIIFALAVKAAVILMACFGIAQMWMSVLADTGVCVACILYTTRLLHIK